MPVSLEVNVAEEKKSLGAGVSAGNSAVLLVGESLSSLLWVCLGVVSSIFPSEPSSFSLFPRQIHTHMA